MRIFSIPSAPRLEAEISPSESVESDALALKKAVESRPAEMSHVDYLRFRILRQQFDRGYFPLLPTTVKTVRKLHGYWSLVRSFRKEA